MGQDDVPFDVKKIPGQTPQKGNIPEKKLGGWSPYLGLLLHHSEFLIRIILRPSFEHASLTCYTLLSPSITFSLFHSELETYLFRKLCTQFAAMSVSICRTDLVALDHLLDLLAHRFLCFNSIFQCYSYSYVRQTVGQLSGQVLSAQYNVI